MSSYPSFVLERLENIATRTKIPEDELRKKLEEILDDGFIKYDPIFESDDERLHYAINTLWAENVGAPFIKETEAVPVILRVHASVKAWLYARARADEELSALLYDLLDLLQEMDPAHQEVSP